jgi:phosphoglycolate phosphatase
METFFLDLDGTLCDSRPGLTHAFQAAFRALGIGSQYDDRIDSFLGTPLPEAFRSIDATIGDSSIQEGINAFRAAYENEGLLRTPLYDGAKELLEALYAGGAKVWLVTSKPTHYARRILDNLRIASLFDGVIGAGLDELDTKTSLVATALRHSGSAPANCVMLGDRFYDVVGALDNSVYPIGALWGYGTREELFAAGCRSFAENLREFKAVYVDRGIAFPGDAKQKAKRRAIAARPNRSSKT